MINYKKIKIIAVILLVSFSVKADEETDRAREASLERFRKYAEEERRKTAEEAKERELKNADGRWMMELFVDYSQNGKKISDDEMRRIWEIYERKDHERTNEDPLGEKIYALSLIAEFEDISRWYPEFEKIAFSDDPRQVKYASQILLSKLYGGTEREKIILANKPDLLDHFVKFAGDYEPGKTIHIDTVRLHEIAEPYKGKTPPEATERPDRRPSESTAKKAREAYGEAFDSPESIGEKIGKNSRLWIGGICGIIIAATLFRQWMSKRQAP